MLVLLTNAALQAYCGSSFTSVILFTSMNMSSSGPRSRGVVKSADRVLDLLELLAERGREMSHAELAAALAIPKSSLSHLLRNLVARGYLELSEGRGYALGSAVGALARRSVQTFDLVALARAIVDRVRDGTHETAGLNVLRDDWTEVIYSATGTRPLLYTMRVGDRAPLYATSSGKAILGHLPEARRETYLARVRFEAITPYTLRSVAELSAQLAAVRAEGFGYSYQEFSVGIVGMAAPVLNSAGEPVAAINVATPSVRFDNAAKARIGASLKRAVAQLARELEGGAPPEREAAA